MKVRLIYTRWRHGHILRYLAGFAKTDAAREALLIMADLHEGKAMLVR